MELRLHRNSVFEKFRGVEMSEEAAVRKESTAMNILIVDDEPTIRDTCAEVARQTGMRATTVASAKEALEVLESSAVDILLTDLRLQHTNGMDLLKRVHDMHPMVPVIVLTQYGTIDSAVAATRLGAIDYVTKPFRIEELRSRLERAAHAVALQQENLLLREQLRTRPGFGGLIGLSERMQRVYKVIQKVTLHEYPVLILGESGTGKELVAKSVHFSGPRKDRPFVPVDCSSLVPTLIESELFGYVKGAFTGALHGKQGLLEAANGGTLFLDEIGDMPVDLQAKLLRAWRELENGIERAVALGSGPIGHVADLPSSLHYPTTERLPERNELVPLDELERRAILRTLRETAGDKLQAARILGIGKTTLYRKLKQYNLADTSQMA